MKSKFLPWVFLFSATFSSVNASEINFLADSQNNVADQSISEIKLEERVECASVEELIYLVGKPKDAGFVIDKLTNLFFSGTNPVELKIDKKTLEDYFKKSDNVKVEETAEALLENFNYVDINSEIGGGLEISFSEKTIFPIYAKGKKVDLEIDCNYKSTVIDKFVLSNGEDILSYVFRVDNGCTKLTWGNWLEDGWHSYFTRHVLGKEQADLPDFHKADYVLNLGGRYYVVLEVSDGKINQVGDIFDKSNNKYEKKDLKKFYQRAYNKGIKSVRKDKFK